MHKQSKTESARVKTRTQKGASALPHTTLSAHRNRRLVYCRLLPALLKRVAECAIDIFQLSELQEAKIGCSEVGRLAIFVRSLNR